MCQELYEATSTCLPGDFDLAAAVHQDLLNDFSDAHHHANYDPHKPSIYRGGDAAPELGILKWSYDIKKPAVFDFAPLNAAAKSELVSRWLLNLPEVYRYSTSDRRQVLRHLADQPNTRIVLEAVALRIEFDPAISDPPPPPIEVTFRIRADGIVQINSSNAFVFTPLDIAVDDPEALDVAITKALAEAGIASKSAAARTSGGLCYPIDALVKHIIRAFLRTRINQYLIELPLPSAIDLFDGFSVTGLKAVVCSDYLIAYGYGRVTRVGTARRDIPSGSVLIRHDASTHAVTVGPQDEAHAAALTRSDAIPENAFYAAAGAKGGYMYLWVSKRLFQAAADKFLTIDDGESGSDSSGVVSWAWSWWLRLRNSGVSFVDNNRIRIGLDFAAGASASAGIRTHCGTIGFGTALKASLFPKPTLVDLRMLLNSSSRKVKLEADTKPGGITVEPENWWDVIGWVLAGIMTLVGTALWNSLDVALNFIAFDIARLPERFPGTDLSYSTFGFRTSFWGQNHYLIGLGIDFK